MTSYLRFGVVTGLVALVLGTPVFAQNIVPPPVPSDIQVQAGNTVFLAAQGVGTQNYICLPTASGGFAWTFFSPQATLFLTIKFFQGDIRQQVTTHFLSPNPDEGGISRVTWQSSLDSSTVWAKTITPSSDPNFVAPGAIPWVLLGRAGAKSGPTGGSFLAQTTFIQRLNTAGGVAPSTGCSQATDVGATALVPYTADYFFYKAGQ